MLDLEPIRDSADHLLDGTLEDCVRSAGKARRDLLALIAEVEQLRAEQDRIWPDLLLSLELLDTAFAMSSKDLYGAQGANQAHRIIRAIVAGEEPMRPRRVVLTPPDFVKESDF